MKFHPILFSTEMVKAILAGNKTQTRRVVKYKFLVCNEPLFSVRNANTTGRCPYGKPGDVLWVRESWQHWLNDKGEPSGSFMYKLSDENFNGIGWKPSIHMPKTACRLFLQIKNIRVERLHDISEQDAKAEGVETLNFYEGYEVSSRGKFEGLWNLINGIDGWELNPWVWVIEFERIEKPKNFC